MSFGASAAARRMLRRRITCANGIRAARGCNAAGGWKLQGNRCAGCGVDRERNRRETTMRGILLWLIGLPIPIIILLYLFGVL
jgi:hypothetical protein